MNLKKLSLLLAAILAVTMLFCACTAPETPETSNGNESVQESGIWASAVYNSDVSVGEGGTVFTLKITAEDRTITVTVSTDEAVLGDALVAAGLIAGEEGDYGLYIKTVNGTTADFSKDNTNWAFYVDGEYAMTGADMTDVVDGTVYTFRVEK